MPKRKKEEKPAVEKEVPDVPENKDPDTVDFDALNPPTEEEIEAAFIKDKNKEEKEEPEPSKDSDLSINYEEEALKSVKPSEDKTLEASEEIEPKTTEEVDYKGLYEEATSERDKFEEQRRAWQSSYEKDVSELRRELETIKAQQKPTEPPKPKIIQDYMPKGTEYDPEESGIPGTPSFYAKEAYDEYRIEKKVEERFLREREKEAKEKEEQALMKFSQDFENLKSTMPEDEFNDLRAIISGRNPDGTFMSANDVAKLFQKHRRATKASQEATLKKQADNGRRMQNIAESPSMPWNSEWSKDDKEFLREINIINPD
jgi:hypothetical protein